MIRSKLALIVAASTLALGATVAQAQDKQLTLCWAAWDPANALVELSKDFTAKTGIQMKFEFVPWTSFADRFLNELNSHGKLCDLLIGDSQWIGGAATNGHYVKLNDFFDKNDISMDDFLPATVYAYSTWPKGTPNYWALPAMGDALGWIYRKDWFARPELQAEFKAKYGRELGAAQDLGRAQGDRQVLPGPPDRRQEGLWRGDLHRARLRGHHHGRDRGALCLGLPVRGPEEAVSHGRLRQLARTRSRALEFYKELYKCCTPPGHTDAYMSEDLDAYKSGQVAMQMNWFAFFPGIHKDADVGGDKSASSSIRPEKVEASASSAARASRSSPTPTSKDVALEYIKWFAQPDGAEEVVGARRLFLLQSGAQRPELPEDARRSPPTS